MRLSVEYVRASNICQALPDGTRLALASADSTVRVWVSVQGARWPSRI
jgi:hypothetical protein